MARDIDNPCMRRPPALFSGPGAFARGAELGRIEPPAPTFAWPGAPAGYVIPLPSMAALVDRGRVPVVVWGTAGCCLALATTWLLA